MQCIVVKHKKISFNEKIFMECGLEIKEVCEVDQFFDMNTYEVSRKAQMDNLPLVGIFLKDSGGGGIIE